LLLLCYTTYHGFNPSLVILNDPIRSRAYGERSAYIIGGTDNKLAAEGRETRRLTKKAAERLASTHHQHFVAMECIIQLLIYTYMFSILPCASYRKHDR